VTTNETIMMLSMGVRVVCAVGLLSHVVTKQVMTLLRSTNCVRKTKKLLLIGVIFYVGNIFFAYPIFDELIHMQGDVPDRLVVFSILRTLCVIVTSIAFILLYNTTEKKEDEQRVGFGGKQIKKEKE
jgi:protein-S-isoprenylcysteine O-methyltransferase Ste14